MLEPDSRQLIVDALRPPVGFRLDAAVGTTFSLDLVALMIAPMAFALFDRQGRDGSVREDPVALLQALRSQAERITIFCQAGQIAVPREYRSLFVYLEDAVYPVVPPVASAIFHPKVWYLKFVHPHSGEPRYRLLCLSRNLTFDQSWDTVLQLEGRPAGELRHPELESFGAALVSMADRTRPLPAQRAQTILHLATELAHAEWETPSDFDFLRFWPLGHDEHDRWPFEERRDRMLVIAPFVTGGMLGRLTKRRRGSMLVSRSETFDQMGGKVSDHLAERLVLTTGLANDESGDAGAAMMEPVVESASGLLRGLHAKCYVADEGRRARLWTGSANCTDAAFHGNVEFLVELAGRKDRCGIDAVLGVDAKGLGLRKLLEPYVPQHPEPQELSAAEQTELLLDRARRIVGGMRFRAICALREPGRWNVQLEGEANQSEVDSELQQIDIQVWPVTVGKALARDAPAIGSSWTLSFDLSEQALTPHFAVELELHGLTVEFLIVAELTGAPEDRTDFVLADILKNRADVLRFLLLLLGDVDEALAAFEESGAVGIGAWMLGNGLDTLLEPLVTAFSRDPGRLAEVGAVVEGLRRNEQYAALLPEGWEAIWQPIAAALAREHAE